MSPLRERVLVGEAAPRALVSGLAAPETWNDLLVHEFDPPSYQHCKSKRSDETYFAVRALTGAQNVSRSLFILHVTRPGERVRKRHEQTAIHISSTISIRRQKFSFDYFIPMSGSPQYTSSSSECVVGSYEFAHFASC